MSENSTNQDIWDTIVVGGGPAGLSAALVLGRCRRTVLLFDDGKPRNAVSRALHGFLGSDGIDPAKLREVALAQLAPYPSLVVRKTRVVSAQRTESGFAVETLGGARFRARKLLLAAGVVDDLPDVPGFRELYGAGVFHCPYCDGWEIQNQPLAVYGRHDDKGGGLALEMTQWSRDVVLCSNGPAELSADYRARLNRHGITVREEQIVRLEVTSDVPHQAAFAVVFASGPALLRGALFFNTGRHQSTDLAKSLGCDTYDVKGCTVDRRTQMTHVPGLYVAGDASREVLQVVVAAAEGAEAAIAINTALLHEDLT